MFFKQKLKEDAQQKTEVTCKTKRISKSKSLLILAALTSLGILGRAAFQWVPSVEPILPLAVTLGFYYNWKHGFGCGASGFFLSNFLVWGLQGPWTIFQCLGAGVAGATGGFLGRLSKNKKMFFLSLLIGTIFYEIIVNIGSLTFFPWGLLFGPAFFVAAIPFGIIHIFSSIGFGSIFYAFREKLKELYENSRELEILRTWYSDNSNIDSRSAICRHLQRIKRRGKDRIIVEDRIWREYKRKSDS